MEFDDKRVRHYKEIQSMLEPPDGSITSEAKLQKEISGDKYEISRALKDLIAFGTVELVGTSQYARVRLHKPITSESTSTQQTLTGHSSTGDIWLTYLVKQDDPRQLWARRLFHERELAEKYLQSLVSDTLMTKVPTVSDVWTAIASNQPKEYAVLRQEPVYEKNDLRQICKEEDNTTTLKDVEFPSHRDRCMAAVHTVRDYIHEHDGATKVEVLHALVPEENHPIGHNGAAARAHGFVPGFRDWWWQEIVKPGLRALSDIEEPDDEEGTWRPIN